MAAPASRPRLWRSSVGLTELQVQSDRQVFRQIPGTVHRRTKQAKQMSSALLRCAKVLPPTVELGLGRVETPGRLAYRAGSGEVLAMP